MRSYAHAVFSVLFLLIMVSPYCHAQYAIQNESLCDGAIPITKISFVTDINLGANDLYAHFPFGRSDACSLENIKKSVDILNNRNIFEDISVSIYIHEEGVHVEYKLIPFLVLSQVQFFGNDDFASSELLRISGMKIGNHVFSEDIRESERRIKNMYLENGYPQVVLESRLIADSTSPLVSLEYRIEEGDVQRVKELKFEGIEDSRFDSVRKDIERMFLGVPLKKGLSSKIKKSAYQLLSSKGYALASVVIDIQEKSNGIFTLKINPKDSFKVTWIGRSAISESTLLALLDIENRTAPIRHGAILNWCDDIKSKYVSEGYIDVEVSCDEVELSHVTVTIKEGVLYENFEITFRGNTISRSELLRVIHAELGVHTFSLLGNTLVFSEIQQEAFVSALKSLYVSKGYLDVVIRAYFKKASERNFASFDFEIEERQLYRVAQIDIKNSDLTDEVIEQRVKRYLNSFLYGSYKVIDIAEAIRQAEEDLLRKGYSSVSLVPTYDKDSHVLHIVTKVAKPLIIRDIFISGNYFTIDKIIRRELPFKEGEFVNDYYLEQARTSLLGLGIFKFVELYIVRDGVSHGQCDVQVSVKERETGVFEALTELSTQDGLHIQGQVGQRNLFGTGRALIFSVDGYFKNEGVQNFDAARARAAYGSPKIYGSQMDYQLESFLQTNLNLNRTFKYDRIGTTNSLKFPLLEVFRFSAAHSIYSERLFDVDEDLIINDRDTGSSVYSVVRANIEYDQRDDPFVATEGYRLELGGGVFPEALGSDVPMYEVHTQFTNILPLSTFWSYAVNVRGGLLRVMQSGEAVPLGSRYFIGGRDSLRGYTRYQVGPRSLEGRVVGGDTMCTLNQEVRYQFADQLVGFVFLDFGQSFLVEKADFTGDTKNAISDFRISPGFGTQYLTPIGPLGFEVGFATDREFGERWGRVLLSIGTAF